MAPQVVVHPGTRFIVTKGGTLWTTQIRGLVLLINLKLG
jgi:hypothetical protein